METQLPDWVWEALPPWFEVVLNVGEMWFAIWCDPEDADIVAPLTAYVISSAAASNE